MTDFQSRASRCDAVGVRLFDVLQVPIGATTVLPGK
jgi:hypothetical protein